MTQEKIENRLLFLKDQHKRQHKMVEALEAEKAPEEKIKNHKRLKLSIKDEIVSLEQKLVDMSNIVC